MQLIGATMVQAGFDLLFAFAAVAMLWYTLEFLDNHIENDSCQQTLDQASADARMLYYSYRFLGLCILIGLVIS